MSVAGGKHLGKSMCLVVGFFVLASGCRSQEIRPSQLKLPPGFQLQVFAETGAHPRLMAITPGGNLLVTASKEGQVLALPDANHDGKADKVEKILTGLDEPHGIAFYQGKLFIAETGKVRRYDWNETRLQASNPATLAALPGGGVHFTKTLIFHGGAMYVSVGSDCNVCDEGKRRANVLRFDVDGKKDEVFAWGIRNAVGMAVSPQTKTIWVTENSRDWLGDDAPPDEIDDLGTDGGDFGWPYCYGDRTPDSKFNDTKRCAATKPALVKLPAHVAPLGLAFYSGKQFPQEFHNDLFVALHGSWNRSTPVGYKVVHVRLDAKGNPQKVDDFVTGWLTSASKGSYWGRPVDVITGADGALYISDDMNGAIYRVTYSHK